VTGIHTWTIGIVLAAVIALTAWRLRWLTGSGAVAAWVAGTVAMGAGWDWGILLISYFLASTLLSRFHHAEKSVRAAGRLDKVGARDAAQVASNGGWFVLAALFYWASPHAVSQYIGAGALAASAADTWATEIGTLARSLPRSIVTGERVQPGTSGGVTRTGTIASVAGALFVAGIVVSLGWPRSAFWAALAGGVVGSLVDSLLGAIAQARFWCASCDVVTERRVHDCGSATTFRGGMRRLNNDGVNALATVAGAAVGLAVALGIQ
jgi:uncharacterized protein (TIGR00297 family)